MGLDTDAFAHRVLIALDCEARAICRQWNLTHKPGPLSDKAEFEEN